MTSSPRIRLYTYAMSPYAAKVHSFLLYKGLDFECFYINPLWVKKDLPVGRQIPVLTVGDESRADSTPIGLWLDELFPDHPRLLPEDPEERARLLAIDEWVSESLIPASFRSYPGEGINRVLNGWKLSYVMGKTAQGGLPFLLRAAWPLMITRVGFVSRMIAQARSQAAPEHSLREAKLALYEQFLAHLCEGPFIAGRQTPSLPDFAAWPQFAIYYEMDFRGSEDILAYPTLMTWLDRVRGYLTSEPLVIPAAVRKRVLPAGPA